MEIWGGNQAIQKNFTAPGIDFFVHSIPYRNSESGGGDIYYLTSCASGRISRFLLADVSGHGEAASGLALSLRDLLRNSVNQISQEDFVGQMNREFAAVADDTAFATAIVATFFDPPMKEDEAKHADMAEEAGAYDLPGPIKDLMSLTSKVMKVVAYRI